MLYNRDRMNASIRIFMPAMCILAVALLAAEPAHAFRCKSKLVRDGLHEQQVIAICGEPTARRHLGYTLRSVNHGWRRSSPGGVRARHYPGFSHLSEEVVVTEFIYNFGPRKLMQRLVFEGGILVSIDTIGYGYHDK